MTKVVITGATGNVGRELIAALQRIGHHLDIYAGVKDMEKDKSRLAHDNIRLTPFDFTNPASYQPAIRNTDLIFLLRPPQIAEVKKYFKPIIDTCIKMGVKHIVFLSVQGAEKNSIIPHHKIEKLIKDSGISYTFLRPAYFMQNFTTTLKDDLVHYQLIYLPAGHARFTLVDVRDIGLVAARIILNVGQHINQSYELTSNEILSFSKMAAILSNELGRDIRFESPNLIHFFLKKRKENVPFMLILVMIMLHYFPRFQQEPQQSDWVEKITGKKPVSFNQFVRENKNQLGF